MIMHMGFVKTIKLTNIIFFIIKYSQGPGLHRHSNVPDCQGLEFNDAVFRLSPVLNTLKRLLFITRKDRILIFLGLLIPLCD